MRFLPVKALQPCVLIGLALGLGACVDGLSLSRQTETVKAPASRGPAFVSSGGVPAQFDAERCPQSPFDVVVPLDSLNPPAKPGEPEMTVQGLFRFVQQRNIKSITELMNHMPAHYRNNFSLVEHTRATGQSNLEFPRIVLFGPDGRFLLNVGTKADDPAYHLLDVAELHEDTGRWEFSVLDFSGPKPSLIVNDPSCASCHGAANARPVWGNSLEWTGVFGDNIAPGPQGEALDGRHLERIRAIMQGKGDSPRFDFLTWSPEPLRRGGVRRLAEHAFGADLLVSNLQMGSATARGAYLRLQRHAPQAYSRAKAAILLLAYDRAGGHSLSADERAKLTALIAQFGGRGTELDDLLRALGLDPLEAFSLATLHEKETPDPNWRVGKGDLYELLALQVLDELAAQDPNVKQILKSTPANPKPFNCPNLAQNIQDVVDYKMMHLFHLRGAARYEVNKVFYSADAEEVHRRVFLPVAAPLVAHLSTQIGVQ